MTINLTMSLSCRGGAIRQCGGGARAPPVGGPGRSGKEGVWGEEWLQGGKRLQGGREGWGFIEGWKLGLGSVVGRELLVSWSS